jgi:hypothetical protein
MNIRDKFIEEFKEIFKRQDIKNEIKILFKPIIDMILIEIYPFIYISLVFVIISFLLILAIFILILRNKTFLK